MKTLLSIAALLTVSFVAVPQAEARSVHQGSSGARSFHTYSGQHRNWSSYCWNSRYSCNFYFCPTRSCYYYWYAPTACYYPITYLAQYPPVPVPYQAVAPGVVPLPTQVSAPIQVTNVNTNTVANGAPAIPVPPPGIVPNVR